jgi:Tol biopolymer transport system component
MHRLLLLVLALPLVAHSDLGRATSKGFNYDIVAVDLAGQQTTLAQNPAVDVSPAVARDGRIVFLSTRGGNPDLYVMDGDGRNVRRLTNGGVDWGEDLEWSEASWSPSGQEIAFDGKYWAAAPSCEQHCVNWNVLVIGSDGSGLKRVALDARAPAWSPDGRRLAYESAVGSYFDAGSVTISRLDGSGSVQVKAINGESSIGPVWSPRGGELAFDASRRDGTRMSIYLVRADGTKVRRLTRGHGPNWSPNGSRLSFIDNCKLFTIGRNGKGMRRLSRKGEFVIGAAWSPRGGTLAYVAGTKEDRCGSGWPGNLRLETVSADGKRVHILARESGSSLIWGGPVWTHDGKRILVVRYH